MKTLLRTLLRHLVFYAPWGVSDALLQASIDRLGPVEVGARLFAKLKVVEIGADGDRGVMTSSWNDRYVLPEYAQTGTFAQTIVAALTDFLQAGGTYLDIGANIGLTTVPIARNTAVRCLAFEPEPVNFGLLRRNVARNAPDGNVEFFQIALFRSRGTMELSLGDANIGDHRLTTAGVAGRRSIAIATAPLDDFVDRLTGPVAIKIDTQGAEPFIISGGKDVIGRAGLLAMEFCPYLMNQMGSDPMIVIETLAEFDRIAIMTGGKAEEPHFVSADAAQALLRAKILTATPSDGDYLDILAVRAPHPVAAGACSSP